MTKRIGLTCPKCRTRLSAQGQPATRIRVACPTCGQSIAAMVPVDPAPQSPIDVPTRQRGGDHPTVGFPEPEDQFELVPTSPGRHAVELGPSPRASSRRSRELLMIAAGFAGVLLLIGAGGWWFLSAGRDLANSSRVTNASAIDWILGKDDTPQGIVDEYFELRMASEETREHYGAEKGTREYESRVQRHLTADRNSRDLLLRALFVDGSNHPEARESFLTQNQQFWDRYRFGIPAQALRDREGVLRSDPRLDDLKWKQLLHRYMDESFFGLPEPRESTASKRYLEYVLTLKDIARELAKIRSESNLEGLEQRTAKKIDLIIDYAADYADGNVLVMVHSDHSRAETTFRTLVDALVTDLRSDGIVDDELQNTIDDFTLAVNQVSNPVSRNGERVRAVLAENRDKRKPGYVSPEEKQALEQQARLANRAAESAAEEKQLPQPTLRDHLLGGRDRRGGADVHPAGADPPTSQPPPESTADARFGPDRFGGRRQPERFGPDRFGGGRPSERFGPPSRRPGPPPAPRFDGPDRIQIVIEGSRDTHATVQSYMRKLGIQSYSFQRRGTTTTVNTADPRSVQELADQIDFGKVDRIDREGRVIYVSELTSSP